MGSANSKPHRPRAGPRPAPRATWASYPEITNPRVVDDHSASPHVTDAPIENAPIEYTPIRFPLIEDDLMEDGLIDDDPIEYVPIEYPLIEDTVTEDAPIDDAPIDDAPIEHAPIEYVPSLTNPEVANRRGTIDHTAFPHIMDAIIEYAPGLSLLQLRATSRAFHRRVKKVFGRYVVLVANDKADLELRRGHEPNLRYPMIRMVPTRPADLKSLPEFEVVDIVIDPTFKSRLCVPVNLQASRITRRLDPRSCGVVPYSDEDRVSYPSTTFIDELLRKCRCGATAPTLVDYIDVVRGVGMLGLHVPRGVTRHVLYANTDLDNFRAVEIDYDFTVSEVIVVLPPPPSTETASAVKQCMDCGCTFVGLTLIPTRYSIICRHQDTAPLRLGVLHHWVEDLPPMLRSGGQITLVGVEGFRPSYFGLDPDLTPSEVVAHVAAEVKRSYIMWLDGLANSGGVTQAMSAFVGAKRAEAIEDPQPRVLFVTLDEWRATADPYEVNRPTIGI